MAQFRRGHARRGGKGASMGIRLILLIGILLSLLFFLFTYLPGIQQNRPGNTGNQGTEEKSDTQVRRFLPAPHLGEMVHHRFFSLSYSESHEQAEWVAYELTREMLTGPRVERTDWFEEDPAVRSGSAHYADYRSSALTRGHLVPAADMAFSEDAMEDSFLMSNISPQDRHFNMGVWRELEETTRDWVKQIGHLYIVSGPVFKNVPSRKIGRNGVSVPGAFFKVIVSDLTGRERGVGFLIPNAISDQPLSTYMVTIDEVEEATGLDFNAFLFEDKEEEEIESFLDQNSWPFSLSRFQRRISEWNVD